MESIAAVSTPAGTGGLAVIRLSGDDAFDIADRIWKGKTLSDLPSHTVHLGEIVDENGNMLDQCVATVFHKDRSFTGEPTVEFSIHGSKWLQREIMALLVRNGASVAGPGEFSQRAFLNGRLDLTQAEAIADMIAASSAAAVKIAGKYLKGNFSEKLKVLRENMISIASLLELELDFSEEDVEFADRKELLDLCENTISEINNLTATFKAGKALKEGVSVVIAGVPNAGKSTLLNNILQDEKAIVSEIAGTTRDIIEDTIELNGILYRLYDTAGLRPTDDKIENIGIERAYDRISKADIVLMLIDPLSPIDAQLHEYDRVREICDKDTPVIVVQNKSDIADRANDSEELTPDICISAKSGEGMQQLIRMLGETVEKSGDSQTDILITNARHYEQLTGAAEALERVKTALKENIPGDLIAQDLRQAIHHIGQITGQITSEDLLHSIFQNFCIGK